MVKSIYWYEYRTKKKEKKDFEKDFFKLMNISDFGKTMESVRKHRETKLVTIEKISNYLLSGQNYQTPKLFSKNLITIELKKKRLFKKPFI